MSVWFVLLVERVPRPSHLSRRACSGDGERGLRCGDCEGTRSAFGGPIILGWGSFTCGADVLRTGFGEAVLRPGNLSRVLRVNGDQDVACFDFAFVTLGFNLRNAQTD